MSDLRENKIVIAEPRWKYVVYASVCISLILAGFLTFNAKERHWQFWMAEIVISLFALGILYMLFNPRYRFIGRNSAEMTEYLADKYEHLLRDNGKFTYTETGFVFNGDESDVVIEWNEITRISGRIEDVLSNDDDLVLSIEYGNGHFLEFDEEIPGWLLFRHKMRERFGFSQEWQDKLIDSGKSEIEIYRRLS